jgi:hypothetical protein
MSDAIQTHTGGCHCGAVRFEVDLDVSKGGTRCNCSICQAKGAFSTLVQPGAFRLSSGEDALADYAFGSVGRHRFCRRCGIHSFGDGHLEEVGGDYVSVNLNCLDGVDPSTLPCLHWDGRHDNWHAGPRPTPWPLHP